MNSIKKKANRRQEILIEKEKQRGEEKQRQREEEKQREEEQQEKQQIQKSSESESKDEEEGIAKRLEEQNQIRNRELTFNELSSDLGSEDSYMTPLGAKLTGNKSISSQNNSVSLLDENENKDEYNALEDNPPILTDAKEFKHLGFKETIKSKPVTESIPININVCSDIFKNGSKVNNKYYFPSQFPNITAINNFSIKKGGKRKPNKYTKHKYKNKYTKNKTNKYKYKQGKVKTRKHISL